MTIAAALAVLLDVVLLEIAGVLLELRQNLLFHDVLRDVPVRAEDDGRQSVGEHGRRAGLLAGDDFHVEDTPAVLDHIEAERRNVYQDVARSEIVWQPAPPLYVH